MNNVYQAADINIDEIIDNGHWTLSQTLVLIFVFILFLVDGMGVQVLSFAVPMLSKAWALPVDEFTLPMTLTWVGAGFGTACGGWLGDKIGRKSVMLISVFLFGIMTILAMSVNNPLQLSFVRVISGLGLGGCIPPAIALITECLSSKNRGWAISLMMISPALGGIACSLFASQLIQEGDWQMLFLFVGLVPIVLGFLMLFFLIESPRYLARFPEKRLALNKSMTRLGYPVDVNKMISTRPKMASTNSVSSLFRGDLLRPTIASVSAFFMLYFVMMAILSWLPSILTDRGYNLDIANMGLLVWNSAGIAGALIAGLAVSYYGAHIAIILFTTGASIGSLIIGLADFSPSDGNIILVPIGLTGFMVTGAVAAIFANAASIYPTAVRSTGVGLSSVSGRIGSVCGSVGGIWAFNFGGLSFFFEFAAVILLGVLLSSFLAKKK